ncbi:PQQ-dependent sugar dehydrogenase [Saccharicrinis sp. FJH54]|uniref:PQQ-dependent sugar dehydrogenase n=1 Tax=Saccharicrinis sp. FJH54 TaxID=3344665 RepID=UPI0035D526BB
MNFSSTICMVTILVLIQFSRLASAQDESFITNQIGPDNLLNTPWDLQYGPDGYLWITEKHDGVLLRVNPETAERDELIHLSDLSSSGGQDGLLGFAFHEKFQSDSPYIYVSYTHLLSGERRQKLVRFTYSINGNDGSLSSPVVLLDGLPSSNDHQSGRLLYGPDNKLYYTIGDQGVKVCDNNLAQFLPTQQQIDNNDWSRYPGKVLRLNTDGSIPEDNPVIDGVKSHVYSYGHRNPQGLVFGNNGILYSDEHGPSSDDEINIIDPGKNYGWPYVAGIKDNLVYDNDGCHSNETSFTDPNYQDPLLSLFTPDTEKEPSCNDAWMCRPNIAPSSIAIYENDKIPGWENALLLTSLKKGRVYKVQLDETGTSVIGEPIPYFYTTNRYRDIAIDPDGKSFYIITDNTGKTADASGMNTLRDMQNPGTILKFTYQETLSDNKPVANVFFKIWPNPASNTLFIQVNSDPYPDLNATLINSTGQVVKRYPDLKNGTNETNTEDLAPGIYLLNLQSKQEMWHERVVVH